MPPPNTSVSELTDAHHKAELRLRRALLGDGEYSAGLVKGEEGRGLVQRELSRMRAALAALRELDEARLAAADARAKEAEARAAELDVTLSKIASARARQPRRKSA